MTKSFERVISFDLLRGYLILVIFINHLALSPSLFQFITWRNLFWVSAAEGFFFLSGMMTGLVRKRDSGSTTREKLIHRAFILYITTIVVTLSLTVAANALPANLQALVKPGFATSHDLATIIRTSLLQYTYGFADFLPYYVLFLLAAIPLLYALRNNLWWFVLAIGTISWFEPRIVDWGIYSYYFYWGSYFVFGLVFGYYYEQIKAWALLMPHEFLQRAGTALLVLSASLLLLNYFFMYYSKVMAKLVDKLPLFTQEVLRSSGEKVGGFDQTTLQPLLMNQRTGVLRIVMFVLIGAGAFVLFTRYEKKITKYLGKLLLLFGQQSLRTYIVQAYLIFLTSIFIAKTNFLANTIMAGALVYILWLVIDRGWFKRIVPN